jgi:anti-sigma regulatory factor (Ser/Thr protein kinase)
MSLRPAGLQPLDLVLAATPACVATARHGVARYCADQDLDHDGVALAVSEAVTNAVMHAYRDRESGAVRIFASVAEDALVVVISDDGPGMTPRTDSPRMGRGLFLLSQLASTVEIDDDEDGTRVLLSFEHGA